jgi:hypothetical protein
MIAPLGVGRQQVSDPGRGIHLLGEADLVAFGEVFDPRGDIDSLAEVVEARIYAFSSSFFGVGTIPANTEIKVHSWLHTITMTAKAISLKTIMIASPPHGGRRS